MVKINLYLSNKEKYNVSYISMLIIAMCLFTVVFAVLQANAHWEVRKITRVLEACWKFGYSSEGRTFCKYSRYFRFEFETTKKHHMFGLNPANNKVILIHKPGEANHPRITRGVFREYRVRTVGDCNDCL